MVQQLSPTSIEDEFLYPDSDGQPIADNTAQFDLIALINGGLNVLLKDRDDVFVAADLLWYPVKLTPPQILEGEKPQRQAPDAMVAFGRPKGDRGSYKQWEEDNIPPHVVIEIRSPKNTDEEMEIKFQFYQEYGVEEYYLYEQATNCLQGWLRKGDCLKEIPQIQGWKSPRLGIKFKTTRDKLVLFYPNGERFLSYVETIAERDRRRKENERVKREHKQQIIDRERLEKEQERQRADRIQQEKELEKQRADRAESELQKLQEKLQQLNIDLDS